MRIVATNIACIVPLHITRVVVRSFKQHLRQADVAGKFVEFFGSGVSQLSVADRTTIANMCPEYGAILSFFPVDNVTLKHLKHTGKGEIKIVVHCNCLLDTWQYVFCLKLHSS